MKIQKSTIKISFFKKIFVKICRLLGYEIIDQNNLYIPTSNKFFNEELSVAGKKSINLPLGEVKITKKIKNLDIIVKTCTTVNLVSQTKKRIFEKEKSEYTFRCINSLIKSVTFAKNKMPNIDFRVFVVDYNSTNSDLEKIKSKLDKSSIKNKMLNINVKNYEHNIANLNEKNEKVTDNMKATMCSIHSTFLLAKEQCNDLIYFVEDDYIHNEIAISEMIFTYERISSQMNKELVICPSDYPFLYNKIDSTNIYLGNERHWRSTEETLLTFMVNKSFITKYWASLDGMCKFENSPFEKPLHKIYENELCLSPMPSLALHCTNVNSVFGLSPGIDWKKIWDENAD